jgi:hypothetical protein
VGFPLWETVAGLGREELDVDVEISYRKARRPTKANPRKTVQQTITLRVVGVRHPPLVVYLIASVAMLFPLLMVVQVLLLRDVTLGEAVRRFAWTPAPIVAPWEYLFATVVAWFLAFSVYQVKRWSWWGAVGVCALLVAHNLYVITQRVANLSDLKLWVNVVITVAPAIAVTLLLQREVRAPFFNPRIRWWEQDPRYPIDAPLEGGGCVLDISSTGMFIEWEAEAPKAGSKASYTFTVGDIHLAVEAEVIWVSAGDDTHPPGAGLRFAPLGEAARRDLFRLLEEQRKLGRRQWRLRAVRYPADIRCNQDEAVLDISMTGMFIQSSAPRKVGW